MTDAMLEATIAVVETGEYEPEVTLVVDGIFVSGDVIPHREFIQHHEVTRRIDELASALPQPAGASGQKAASDEPPQFIHLRNARCLHGPAHDFVPDNGCHMRVRLDAVSAFWFGRLESVAT